MIFVIIQFTSLGILIFYTDIFHFTLPSILLLLFSGVLGILAIRDMKIDNLNITPHLKTHHILVTRGIYKHIRHPMYSALLLFGLAIMLTNTHYITISVYVVLIIDLYFKSNVEEKLLLHTFKDYKIYKQTTGKFIPKL
jgi:protein-S-isoprenylcysteine O-methyltransferase Ste14